MLRVALALLTVGLGTGASASAWAATESDDEAETPALAPVQGQPAAKGAGPETSEAKVVKAPSTRTSTKTTARKSTATSSKGRAVSTKSSRRSRSRAKVVGHVVSESKLRTMPLPPPSGNVHIKSLASHEALKVNVFNEDGSYSVDALKEVAHILRCKRTETEREMEPRLVTILSHVYDQYGGRPIEIVSGYRNQRRTSSHHYRGAAVDIRVPGVKYSKLRAFVESLDAGGMGIGQYPRTGFVHVDVRPPPSYRWTDWSRSDPDSADKRPPRGVKKVRKPVS